MEGILFVKESGQPRAADFPEANEKLKVGSAGPPMRRPRISKVIACCTVERYNRQDAKAADSHDSTEG